MYRGHGIYSGTRSQPPPYDGRLQHATHWLDKNGKQWNFEQACINKLNDHFMYPHVTTATRFSINHNTNILDLVLTNEEHMIPDGVITECPLRASDHSLLSFSFQCYTKQKSKSHTTLMYLKADYDAIWQDLRQDWDILFENMTTNQMWSILQNIINTAINKHVPQTKSVLISAAKRNPIWMSYKALIKVTKHKAWQRYEHTWGIRLQGICKGQEPSQEWNNENTSGLRNIYSKSIKTNPKYFWRYVTSELKTTGEVPHLKRNDGSMTETDEDKVHELNTYFISVFTHEQGPPPTIGQRPFTTPRSDIQISIQDITLRLKNMNPNKSPGPDNQHPCVFNFQWQRWKVCELLSQQQLCDRRYHLPTQRDTQTNMEVTRWPNSKPDWPCSCKQQVVEIAQRCTHMQRSRCRKWSLSGCIKT